MLNTSTLTIIFTLQILLILVLASPILAGIDEIATFNEWTHNLQLKHIQESYLNMTDYKLERVYALREIWYHLGNSGTLSEMVVDWGTMMGAEYLNSFLPGDYDIDLWVPSERWGMVLSRLEKYFSGMDRYIIKRITHDYPGLADARVFIVDTQYGIYADITTKTVKGGKLHRGYYPSIARGGIGSMFLCGRPAPMDYSDVYPTREWEYMGFKVMVPNKSRQLCALWYGRFDDAKLPVSGVRGNKTERTKATPD